MVWAFTTICEYWALISSCLHVELMLWLTDVRCPVCHKMIPADDVECHLVMCLTKPRITYNGRSIFYTFMKWFLFALAYCRVYISCILLTLLSLHYCLSGMCSQDHGLGVDCRDRNFFGPAGFADFASTSFRLPSSKIKSSDLTISLSTE